MHLNTYSGTDFAPRLTSHDLVAFEHILHSDMAELLSFTSASLYFPQSFQGKMLQDMLSGKAVWLKDEQKIFVPLLQEDEILGIFMAKGVRMAAPKTMCTVLPAAGRISLEKLALYKYTVTDVKTGLATKSVLDKALTVQIENIKNTATGMELEGAGPQNFMACFGIIVLCLHNLQAIAEKYGQQVAAQALPQAAEKIKIIAPKWAIASKLGDTSLAVLLPGATPQVCAELAKKLAQALQPLTVWDNVLQQKAAIATGTGYALYPKNIQGREFSLGATDLAQNMAGKALRAARAATGGEVLAFDHILHRGGIIKKVLPLGQVEVDLNTALGAVAGQHFLVWPLGERPQKETTDHTGSKGEIVLTHVRADHALAAVIHQTDPGQTLVAGDQLSLVGAYGVHETPEQKDEQSGLLSYNQFLLDVAKQKEAEAVYSIAIISLPQHESPTRLTTLAEICQKTFTKTCKVIGGRASLGATIWYLPGLSGKKTMTLCERASKALGENFPEVSIGIAFYPFLSFDTSQTVKNAHKALEYARLLPAPHIGLIDSLALNIYADRLYAEGELYDAIEEYKLALTADRANTMARNSLGICLALSGDISAAKRQFKTVLGQKPDDTFALYNYGYACQRMGQTEQAKIFYRKCLKADAGHIYSLIRLGQLAQTEKRYPLARRHFNQAATLPGGRQLTQVYLACLDLEQGNIGQAKNSLHKALKNNPKDPTALNLMARIYLESKEDLEVAETLARQAVALAPDHPPFSQLLAKVLYARGKTEEAAKVLQRIEQ